jgi:hypothetical protein
VRDSSGKPGAVGNREDLERIARPEGARPTMCKARMPAANASRMSSTIATDLKDYSKRLITK